MNNKRGSLWKKWDLHCHTPFSYDFQYHSDDWLEKYINQINSSEVLVFAITDHYSIEGYKLLSKNIDKIKNKIILPGIELRLDDSLIPSRNEDIGIKNDRPIHLQIIFDNNPQVMSDIEEFIRMLKFKDLQGVVKEITPANIIEFGKKIKGSCDDKVAYRIGCENIRIGKDVIEKSLEEKGLKNKSIIVFPYEKYGGIDPIDPENDCLIKTRLTKMADIIESSDQDQINFFLGKSKILPYFSDLNSEILNNKFSDFIGKRKACVNGSDCHSIENLGVFVNNKNCWIKADPTFEGLKQILVEPENRVLVDEYPQKYNIVKSNKTKYINKITISKVADSNIDDKWFNDEIVFNVDLIAIIGNKGSGKSALADALALLGNTKIKREDYSFLNEDKFLDPKDNIAKHFSATLEWFDKQPITKILSDDVDMNEVENIKYIPQNYLEKICNETDSGESHNFENELEKAIFTHVDDIDTYGKKSIKELLEYKTSEKNEAISIIKNEIAAINKNIVELENRLEDEYKKSLENRLIQLKKELESHLNIKPKEPKKPVLDKEKDTKMKYLNENIQKKEKELKEVLENNQKNNFDLKQVNLKMLNCSKIVELINNFRRQSETFKKEIVLLLNNIDINIDDIVSFNAKESIIMDKRNELLGVKNGLEVMIKTNSEKIIVLNNEIKVWQDKLDEDNKNYNSYLNEMKIWESKRKKIVGSEDEINTIKNIERELSEISVIPKKVVELKNERKLKVQEIFTSIKGIVEIYSDLYKPVQEFVDKNDLVKRELELNFQASVIESRFEESFFHYITHNISGTFCGKESGCKILKAIINKYDFNIEENVFYFIDEIIDSLEFDRRTKADSNKNKIISQMREKSYIVDFYNYLFSLDYLKPYFTLNVGERSLDQLSPGEKGTLLLIFYLLIDKQEIPLIIDQPEGNLDNETVYKVLVYCIKEAKKKRQIFIVTHNPNLAVVCDAEQVIYSKIDKKDGNKVEYISGSIENPVIKKHIIRVLEGTRPAFNNRKEKYED